MKRVFGHIKTLASATIGRALEVDIITQGAAIAFYTIFSIAPIFVLIISISGFFSAEEVITRQIEQRLQSVIGEESATLSRFIQSQLDFQGSIWTTVTAVVLVAFGATTVIGQIKYSLNMIWGVREERFSIWSYLLNRLVSFGLIILISILLIASLLAEGIISLATNQISELLPMIPIDLYVILSRITTISFAVLFFALVFRILPDVRVRWKDIFIGALVTTLLFGLGRYLIGLYLSASGISATYRAAGSLVILIVWVYYNIQTILLGAVFTREWTERFGGGSRPVGSRRESAE